jgi:hypothetical protein
MLAAGNPSGMMSSMGQGLGSAPSATSLYASNPGNYSLGNYSLGQPTPIPTQGGYSLGNYNLTPPTLGGY